MGRKKKHKRQAQAEPRRPSRAPGADAPASASRAAHRAAPGAFRRLLGPVPLVAAGVTVAAGWLAWLVLTGRVTFTGSVAKFPDPRPVKPAAGYALEDFAGAEKCRECHEQAYTKWRGSTHGRAGGSPSAELVISRFDGKPIRFADAVVTPGEAQILTTAQRGLLEL